MTIGGMDIPPAERKVSSFMFTGFLPGTVCEHCSPFTPIIFCSFGMSGILVLCFRCEMAYSSAQIYPAVPYRV